MKTTSSSVLKMFSLYNGTLTIIHLRVQIFSYLAILLTWLLRKGPNITNKTSPLKSKNLFFFTRIAQRKVTAVDPYFSKRTPMKSNHTKSSEFTRVQCLITNTVYKPILQRWWSSCSKAWSNKLTHWEEKINTVLQ